MARWPHALLLMLTLSLLACTHGVDTVAGGSGAVLRGTVLAPAQFLGRTATTGAFAEVAASGATVRLLTRQGQPLPDGEAVQADSQGAFALTRSVAPGLYLADARLPSQGRLFALVRLTAGTTATTQITLASTYVASYVARTPLKLVSLDPAQTDLIVAQARGLMAASDVPAGSTDAALQAAADTFVTGHGVIKTALDSMLAGLAIAEGAAPAPTPTPSVLPTLQPGASPTPQPDPVFTPEPTPVPMTFVDLASPSFMPVARLPLDSPAGGFALESSSMVWVTCPASQSIMRLDIGLQRSDGAWVRRYPISNLLKPTFIGAQIAVIRPAPAYPAPAVFVGNQRSDGTQVARYSLAGNYLGAVTVGPAPAAVAVDTASPPHVWMGAHDGTVVVAAPDGTVRARGQVDGPVLKMVAQHVNASLDLVWIATPARVYRVVLDDLDRGNAGIHTESGTGYMVSFQGQADSRFNHPVRGISLLQDAHAGQVLWAWLQDDTSAPVVLVRVPDSLQLGTPQVIAASARAVSWFKDALDVTKDGYLATENGIYDVMGGDVPITAPITGHRLDTLFQADDWSLMGLFSSPPEIVKMAPYKFGS